MLQGSEGPEMYSVLYVEGVERLRPKRRALFSSRLVVHFDRESQIFDHPPDFRRWRARGCEVTVHEDGVGWIKSEWLQAAQIVFAAAGDADFGAGMEEAEEAEHFEAALWRELIAIF